MRGNIAKFGWFLFAAGIAALPGCNKGRSTLVVTDTVQVTSPTPTNSPDLKGLSLQSFHADAANQANDACITCHGDFSTNQAFSASGVNWDFHYLKHSLSTFKDKCVTCHTSVDIEKLTEAGPSLRKTVSVDLCYSCHNSGGTASPLYN